MSQELTQEERAKMALYTDKAITQKKARIDRIKKDPVQAHSFNATCDVVSNIMKEAYGIEINFDHLTSLVNMIIANKEAADMISTMRAGHEDRSPESLKTRRDEAARMIRRGLARIQQIQQNPIARKVFHSYCDMLDERFSKQYEIQVPRAEVNAIVAGIITGWEEKVILNKEAHSKPTKQQDRPKPAAKGTSIA